MAAELSALEPPTGGWTTDDLDELPEDHRRYELIDGALIVSPSPGYIHQTIAARLMAALEESCPAEYVVTQAVELRVSRTRSLIPDVLVATAEAAARRPSRFAPGDVVLVIEVVSPTSVIMDRITKAELYAKAGIPFYWRVETLAGIAVHTHRLEPDAFVYQPDGQFTKKLQVYEPWEITIPVSRITPRYFQPETGH